MKNIFILFFCSFSLNGLAQSINANAISWHLTSVKNVHTGENFAAPGVIISNKSGKIEWKDAAGAVLVSYTITETNGNWSDISSNGEVTFEVRSDSNNGNIRFKRESGSYTVRIIISSSTGLNVYECTADQPTVVTQ